VEGRATVTDLLYSDTEIALRDSVRAMLDKRLTAADVMALYDAPHPPHPQQLWTALRDEIGVTALLVPESAGGHGAGAREAAVVLEELGRRVAPVPFLTSAVVATWCLTAAGDTGWLPRLASGDTTAVLCVPLVAATSTWAATAWAEGAGLVGEVRGVADGAAGVLVVPVRADDAVELHVVDPGAGGVRVTPVLSLDMSRPLADIAFDGAPSRVICRGVEARLAVDDALTAGAALLASEQLGLAEWCLDTTVKHLRDRYQFGRPLGSFQALKHRLADLVVDITASRAVARYAADCLATNSDDAAVAASLAQAHCATVAVRAAEECIQLLGGIGMTWEHPAHLYLKRAKADQLAFGTPAQHRARLAELVDVPAAC
jgi:alkylation response protein AidB-like acyl-CoA dehydrogenase